MSQPNTAYDKDDKKGVPHSLPNEDKPAGNYSDPRSAYNPQTSPMGDSSDPTAVLRKKEEGAGMFNKSGDGGSAMSGASGKLGGGAGGLASKAKGSLSSFFSVPGRKKKAAIGGGATVATVTAVVAFMGLISGPLEFVHLGQLLEKFHFSSQEDMEDGRLTKIARYIRDPGDPKRTRLGGLGNDVADALEKKMNGRGITSDYTPNRGYGDGYTVDMNNERFKDKSTKQVREDLAKDLGIDADKLQPSVDSSGKQTLKIDSKSLSYRQQVKLNRSLLKDAGYGKISSAIGSRVMGKRAALTWHPIQKLDQKALEAGSTKWKQYKEKFKKDQAKYISEGAKPPTADSKKKVKVDENGDPVDPADVSEADQADQAIKDTQSASEEANTAASDGDPNASKTLKEKLSSNMKVKGGGALAIVGVACMIRGLSKNVDSLKQAQLVLPMIRMGAQAMSLGSQVMSNEDISLEQLGLFSDLLHTKDENGRNKKGGDVDWNQAKSIQYESGVRQTGPDIPDQAKAFNQGNPLDFLDSAAGVLDPVCEVVGSTVGTILGFALSGGPISAVAQEVGSRLLIGPVMEKVAAWLAGAPINALATGAERGNYMNFGGRLAANDQAVASGGAELTKDEELALKHDANAVRDDEFRSQSFAHRIFSPTDSQSLLAKVIDNNSSGTTQTITNTTNNFASIFAAALKTPATFLTRPALAASGDYDYGFPAFGFSQAEQADPAIQNPMKNAIAAADILAGSNGGKMRDRAKKCLGVTITDSEPYDVQGGDETTSLYSKDYPSECKEKSTDWLSIRTFVTDTGVMKAYACFEGDDEACTDLGAGGGGTSSSTSSGTVSGDSQELAQQILDNKNVTYPLVSGGHTADDVLKNVVKTGYGFVDGDNAPRTKVKLSEKMLKTILEYAQGGDKVGINCLSNCTHTTSSSEHYTGQAVDFDCSVPLNESNWNKIMKKYGGSLDSGYPEICPDQSHWHFRFPKSGE